MTHRYIEAWALRRRGLSRKETAAKMNTTPNTISGLWFHYRRARDKGLPAERLPRIYTERFSVALDLDTRDRLRAMAEAEGRSVNEIVRTFIEWGFNALDGE